MTSILIITSGDTESFAVAVTDPDTGTAVDLSGTALAFMVKRHIADANADAVMTKTTSSGITLTNAAGGLATIAIAPADTEDMNGVYHWELQGAAGATVTTLAAGNLRVQADLIS